MPLIAWRAEPMRPLIMRELPPPRRESWVKSALIDGQEVTFGVGLYEDGRPCELFIDMSKEGSTMRGVLGTLARMVSISLQHGASIKMVCRALRGIDYPPCGAVCKVNKDGPEPCVSHCDSLTEWIAAELTAAFPASAPEKVVVPVGQGDPPPTTDQLVNELAQANMTSAERRLQEKVLDHTQEKWRTGA